MVRLYSYVVEHDYGLSPNPTGGFCTLAFCKFSRDGITPNVVELAEVGDWVVGTGGKSRLSAGHGRLVYAMRVTEKLTLRDYFRDPRFTRRAGNVLDWAGATDMFALVSDHFYYFGASAPRFAKRHLEHPIEKRGPRHRCRFSEEFIADFVDWLERGYAVGVHGRPCADHPGADPFEMEEHPRKKCPPRRKLSIC
jgi:hypothetical protein